MRIRTVETKLYTYSELSDRAKEKARDWWREASAGDNFFAEYVTEQFHEELKALGFDVMKWDRDPAPGTKARARSTVEWSGFWSQGDGAAFSGTWSASDFAPDALLTDRPAVWPEPSGGHACPANAELHRIAAELRACADAGLAMACVEVSNRGFHMRLADSSYNEPERDTEPTNADCEALCTAQLGTDERFITAARDLASAFYRALEAEYEYQNSDEQVAESIEANEYEFTEAGEFA